MDSKEEDAILFICPDCPAILKSRRNLRRHEQVHVENHIGMKMRDIKKTSLKRKGKIRRRIRPWSRRPPALEQGPQFRWKEDIEEEKELEMIPNEDLTTSLPAVSMEGAPGDLVRLTKKTNLLLVAPLMVTGIEVPIEWSRSCAMQKVGMDYFDILCNERLVTDWQQSLQHLHQIAQEQLFRESEVDLEDLYRKAEERAWSAGENPDTL